MLSFENKSAERLNKKSKYLFKKREKRNFTVGLKLYKKKKNQNIFIRKK